MAPTCRFVVIAPIGRDAELICGLLQGSGHAAESLPALELVEQIPIVQLLGLVITAEALREGGLDSLRRIVKAQPSWSEIPIILLTAGPGEPAYAALIREARNEMQSVLLLDRPLRMELLLSAAQAISRSRLQQLEIRDAAERQVKSDTALRNSEKLAATGRLVASMAHEVSNPLAALSNLLYLVEISNSHSEAQSYGRLAARELKRIIEIVDNTLHFNRTPPQPAPTDLSDLAASAVSLFRGKLQERKVTLNTATKRAAAFCSPGEIRQALVNLIGNAIDALPIGGHIWIRVSQTTVRDRDFARITIADSGKGIPSEIRANLFTPFFTTKGSRGTGLGLWLTRDIVQRNGGKLHLRSRTDSPSGTVFSIYLPAAGSGGQTQTPAPASSRRLLTVAAPSVQ
jgi:signal transduction histidine kinase